MIAARWLSIVNEAGQGQGVLHPAQLKYSGLIQTFQGRNDGLGPVAKINRSYFIHPIDRTMIAVELPIWIPSSVVGHGFCF